MAWARVYVAMRREVAKHLRQGTWYPVVRDDAPDRLTLRIGVRTVDVPRRMLEIRWKRPTHFTVVSRLDLPPEERKSAGDAGKRYLVCPECSSRTTLSGEPRSRDCPVCGHQGEVGWWES